VTNNDFVCRIWVLVNGPWIWQLPKGKDSKDWDWFLEDIKRSSDDKDDEVNSNKGRSKCRDGNKRKKDGEGQDEDWTDESEDEKGSLSTGRSVKRTKYVTRSKDLKRPQKENSTVKSGNSRNEDEVVDEDDETLGGFIVNEEDDAMDELSEEEEEDEFDDEDDDDW
jgi:hypothetical protein